MEKAYTAQQILQAKGKANLTVAPDTLVYDALQMMAQQNVGALPVMENGTLVGIISEHDYARQILPTKRDPSGTPVGDIMSTKIVPLRPEASRDDCMKTMTYGRFRHLPVMEGGHVMGIISIGDIVGTMVR